MCVILSGREVSSLMEKEDGRKKEKKN
jgi:hypothetical protein